MSMLQAISAAGGLTSTADQRRVALIRRRELPLPESAVVNMKDILAAARKSTPVAGATLRKDIWMNDGDILYVPATPLARLFGNAP